MVLDYYGFKTTEKQIAKICNHTYKKGCNNEDMVNCLMQFGLGSSLHHQLTIEDLKYWSLHKVPVIVDWFPFEFDHKAKFNYGHSCVVKGLDKKHIYLLDPLQKTVSKVTLRSFQDTWFDYDNANNEINGTGIITYPAKLILPLKIPV